MENLKLCEIITSGDYGSMTDLTDNQNIRVVCSSWKREVAVWYRLVASTIIK